MYYADPSYYPFIQHFIRSIRVCDILFSLSGFNNCSCVVLTVYAALSPLYPILYIVYPLYYPFMQHSIRSIHVCNNLFGLSGFVICPSVELSVYSTFHRVYLSIRPSSRFIRRCRLLLRCSIALSGNLFGLLLYRKFYLGYPALYIAHQLYYLFIWQFIRSIGLTGILSGLSGNV